MATPGAGQGARRRTVVGAILALTVHLVALGLLTVASPRPESGPPDARAISVDLVTPAGPRAPRPRPAPRAPRPGGSPVSASTVEVSHPMDQSPAVAALPTPAPNVSQPTRPAGVALRNSVIGCSFARVMGLNDAERGHCLEMFARRAEEGPDLSGFAVAPARRAAFDAAADRETFLQKPFLSARPRNGCKPFIDHQQYAQLGAARDAYSVSFGCGKTF